MRAWAVTFVGVAAFSLLPILLAAIVRERRFVPSEHEKLLEGISLLAHSIYVLAFLFISTCVHATVTSKPKDPSE